jgi:hypothetical protein
MPKGAEKEIPEIMLTRYAGYLIDRLAEDLQAEFPDMGGFTRHNLFSMRAFAEAFPGGPIVKQLVSQLPWGQIIRVIQMVKDPAARDFYIRETLNPACTTANRPK